ncbi:hypothetical protein L1987_38131 [Smallanthus sonchifolius]|uniref:Uncharacterized protein n=1 Tax=Smallanthus sonchifolius TaxID=185202 RepID=A0ACB9HJN9_9ASTR|nr:hypothetical protein L1987_38131 [Smallanthus sonchifolius]
MLFELTAIHIDARPHPEEYWQDSFVRSGTSMSPQHIKKSHCHTLAKARNHISSVDKELEPRPNVSSYGNDVNPEGYDKDFEPRPNISTYDDRTGLKLKKNSDEEFEPRPNISVYDNDTDLKGKKNYDEEFEPKPNTSAYDSKTRLNARKNSNEKFEPRPNVSVYDSVVV